MYHHLSQYYNQLFPEDPKLSHFIKGFAKPLGKAIDLGCGTGRLTQIMSRHQMDVKGIDLDEDMIHVATSHFPDLKFEVADMVEVMQQNESYSLITCFGNTLPHLNQAKIRTFFQGVKKHLRPDGYMIVQMLNYDKILKEKPAYLKEITYDHVRFQRQYTYHKQHIVFKTILHVDGSQTEGQTKIYPYRQDELKQILTHIKLQYQCYGDLALKPFELSDYYLYIVVTQN